jgi:hypothetical protein
MAEEGARGARGALPAFCYLAQEVDRTGGIRYQVGLFCAIIIYNFSPRILRFTGPTTHRWKQEKIPPVASEPDFEFRA